MLPLEEPCYETVSQVPLLLSFNVVPTSNAAGHFLLLTGRLKKYFLKIEKGGFSG
jgi:hypothetical protein